MNAYDLTRTAVGAVLLTAIVPAMPALAGEEDKAVIRAVTVGEDGTMSTRAEAIQVRVENDEITVMVNGEAVPADRIRREDGQVIILDEDGNELRSVGIFVGEDDPIWWFGDEENDFRRWRKFVDGWQQPGAEPADPPKVMLGVYLVDPGEALRYHLGLDNGKGVMVAGVADGVAADQAGLRQHDVIVDFDGHKSVTRAKITEILADHEPGDRVHMTVIQAGEIRPLDLLLDAYDAERLRGLGGMGIDMDFTFDAPGLRRLFPQREELDTQDVLVDPGRNVFVRPRIRVQTAPEATDETDTQEDRIDRLNRRIEELQRALERVLEATED